MAKVVKVYPGADGLVRAVDVQLEKRNIPGECKTKEQLIKGITTKTSILRRPITKLALLLAIDEEKPMDLEELGMLPEGSEGKMKSCQTCTVSWGEYVEAQNLSRK